MTNKHFDAILAKNNIAREIASGEPNNNYIIAELKAIEAYIGESNQPSVDDIIANNSNPNREFVI